MKKVMIIFVSVLMISLMACSKADEIEQSWIFTITTVQSINPAMQGYPMTSTMTIEKDNLTADEADQALKGLTTTTTITNAGYTLTTTTTATKALKQ
jgi:hypothetical protein